MTGVPDTVGNVEPVTSQPLSPSILIARANLREARRWRIEQMKALETAMLCVINADERLAKARRRLADLLGISEPLGETGSRSQVGKSQSPTGRKVEPEPYPALASSGGRGGGTATPCLPGIPEFLKIGNAPGIDRGG